MQIVINIDDDVLLDIQRVGLLRLPDEKIKIVDSSIQLGTPLPKGHGDLITKEQAIELVEFYQINPQHFNFINLIDEIKDEKPIIESDRSEEE